MIQDFFNTTFQVTRQSWSGDSSALISKSSFNGHIQQGTDENLTESVGLSFTKAFTIWCVVGTDVEEGDRLTSGDDEYDVKFKINRNMGNNAHLRLLVEKLDD